MVPTIDKQHLLDEVDALIEALRPLAANGPMEKAVYHAERLRVAIRSSHNEAIRFAAFTVRKILRDASGQVPPDVPGRVQEIVAALEAMGHDLSK